MGAEVATIAQASVAGGQGGSSNLQKFKAHHPPTFMGRGGGGGGGGNSMVADYMFR